MKKLIRKVMYKQMKIMTFMPLLLLMFFSCTHAQEKSKNKECPKTDSAVNVEETNLQQKDSLCADNRNKEKWGPGIPAPELPMNLQRLDLPIFERKSGKMVGYMGSETIEDDNNKEYYVLDTLTVLGHQVISKNEIYSNKYDPYVSWYIDVKELNDTAEISYWDAIRSNAWRGLYLTKGKNGSLKIIKIVDVYSKESYLDYQCGRICRINLNETVRGVIDIDDLYDRHKKEGRCINCPYKYSYTEALQFLEEGHTKFDEKEYEEKSYYDNW